MSEESNVMASQPESPPAVIPEAGSGLVNMLEHLEQGVKDTWHEATTGVADTMASVRASVGTAGHAVEGAVHDGAAAMGRGLDVAAHVRRHPGLMVGGAVLLGFAVGVLVNCLHRRDAARQRGPLTPGPGFPVSDRAAGLPWQGFGPGSYDQPRLHSQRLHA